MPNAEAYWNKILSFPTFTYEPYELIDKYVEAIKKVVFNVEEFGSEASHNLNLTGKNSEYYQKVVTKLDNTLSRVQGDYSPNTTKYYEKGSK